MTLCVAWRSDKNVHFASDSRVSFASNSYADVGIKVISIPYNIYAPDKGVNGETRTAILPNDSRVLVYSGALGMCFAGSAVNSMVIKESISELLKDIQYIPNYTSVGMDTLIRFIYAAYCQISVEVCKTSIGGNGRSAIIIAGWCNAQNSIRSYLMKTSAQNVHSCTEILKAAGEYIFIGNAEKRAQSLLPNNASDKDYLLILKQIIDDSTEHAVGGSIQYGEFKDQRFRVCGIAEFNEAEGTPHYWRGALDMNGEDFMGSVSQHCLIPGFSYIDPFDSFSKT